jgi:uncharacterized protein YhaN
LSVIESELCDRFSGRNIESVLMLLNEAVGSPEKADELQTEYAVLESEQPDLDNAVSRAFHEWEVARSTLESIGADESAARLQERLRLIYLQIEEESREFMRLSLGIAVAEQALGTFRAEHRSSMLQSASEAFSRITRGAFDSLAATEGGNGEILYGLRRDGSSLLSTEMSRGTRFQLFLALRIAGHKEFARGTSPLPFFADDILESFDDDRSEETFSLLHEISKKGQVIYLTHHRHLCEIAKSVVGKGLRIHELPH